MTTQGTSSSTLNAKRVGRRKKPVTFLAGSSCRYPVVRSAAAAAGWKLIQDGSSPAAKNCNVYWVDTSNIQLYFNYLEPWQCINHFPGMINIARKSKMAEHLEKMREKFPSEFAFYPQTFVLPRDMTELRKSFGRTGKSRRTFIVKPDGGCQGRGIYLTRDFSDIDTAATCVAQHYIHRPFLIENKKFDLRIYVLVTSCKPLRIYLFRDGLVRMCTENFMAPTAENLDDKCMHLTNYAINRKSENFKYESSDEEVATRIGEGSKRTIQWFVSWLRETEGDHVVNTMWSEIGNICAKTVISVSPVLVREYDKVFGLMDMYSSCPLEKKVATSVPKAAKAEKLSGETATASFLPPPPSSLQKQSRGSRCFQILGFDIMIDSQFKPNLIEVNHLPSYGTDCRADRMVKEKLMRQTFAVVNAKEDDKTFFEHARTAAKLNVLHTTISSVVEKDTTACSAFNGGKDDEENACRKASFSCEIFETKLESPHIHDSCATENQIGAHKEPTCEIFVESDENADKSDAMLDEVLAPKQLLKGEKSQQCAQCNNSATNLFQVDSNTVAPFWDDEYHCEEDLLLEDFDRIYPSREQKPLSGPKYDAMLHYVFEEDRQRQFRLTGILQPAQSNVLDSKEWKYWNLHRRGKSEDAKLSGPLDRAESRISGDFFKHKSLHECSVTPKTPGPLQKAAADRMCRGLSSVDVVKQKSFNNEQGTKMESDTLNQISSVPTQEIRKRWKENASTAESLNRVLVEPVTFAFEFGPKSNIS